MKNQVNITMQRVKFHFEILDLFIQENHVASNTWTYRLYVE